MRLSLMIMTKNGSWRLERTIRNLREKVDQVVVGVDTASNDDTMERAQRAADCVYAIDNPQGYIEPHIGPLFNRCEGDWVIRLDDDELMSTNFELAAIPSTALEEYDLIGFPRAWIVSGIPPLYIGTGTKPGELVPQYRLMRRSANWTFVSKIHTPGFEMKPAYVTPNVYMYHLNLVDVSLEDRRRKYDFYQSQRDAPWNKTYLLDPIELAGTGSAFECTSQMYPPKNLILSGASDYAMPCQKK